MKNMSISSKRSKESSRFQMRFIHFFQESAQKKRIKIGKTLKCHPFQFKQVALFQYPMMAMQTTTREKNHSIISPSFVHYTVS